jgi:nucleoside-diphosphate-sugar epimerase
VKPWNILVTGSSGLIGSEAADLLRPKRLLTSKRIG